MKVSKKGRDLVTKYCEENKDVLSLTLAKLIYKKHPKLFTNVECVRGMVRNRRRANGRNGSSFSKDLKREQKHISEWMKKVPVKETPKLENLTPAKILIFDIETAPLRAYVWGRWKQNIHTEAIISDWFMLCWSAKWFMEDKVYSGKVTAKELANEDDKRICESLWGMINEADIVIAHNLKGFDKKRMNARFLMNGINPPSPYQEIDTLLHARKQMALSSNRLDDLGAALNVGRKIETGGFKLWKDVMEGDMSALDKMDHYCGGDVGLLEEVYLELRPWIKPHPNMGLFIGDDIARCPSCSSDDLKIDGYYRTYVNEYDSFRCGNCGSQSRSRKSNIKQSDFPNLKTSLP